MPVYKDLGEVKMFNWPASGDFYTLLIPFNLVSKIHKTIKTCKQLIDYQSTKYLVYFSEWTHHISCLTFSVSIIIIIEKQTI